MAANSPDLVPIPESWKTSFKLKPSFDYKDVPKTELHIWKINALKRGYLKSKAEKKRFLQKHWDSYYIVIKANLVLFFQDCKQSLTSKPHDYIPLSPRDTLTAQVKTSEKHKYCFAIKTAQKDDRDWVFSASTADEMQMWMAALEATIDFMSHGRIKKWSFKILEKELPVMTGPKTEDNEETSRHEYTDIPYEEICASDDGMYDLVQPDKTYLTDVELSKLADNFGHGWKDFAREDLRLKQPEIDRIESKNKNDLKEQVVDALLLWKKKQVGPNIKAKLIKVLKDSTKCDPEALLCLENPDSNGYRYVTLKKDHTEECSLHTYYDVTPRKQTLQRVPLYSRTLYATNSPIQVREKTPTSNGESPVIKDTHRRKPNKSTQSSYGALKKNWYVMAEMKEKLQERASTQFE